MGTKELRVNALELNRLGVACPNCKSEIVFEAAASHGPSSASCPNCLATRGATFPIPFMP